jgi:hypothetical protein
MPARPAYFRRFAAPALLVLIWAAFFWRILTPNPADRLTFQQGDFTLQFLAYRQMAFASLTQGNFPTIVECLYSGHPFQADPQAQLLYPPVLGAMLLGRALGWETYPLRALEFEVMLHTLLAAAGTYAFLRALGLRRGAALFGSSVFAYGGFMTGYAMLQTGILETAAWLPIAMLALRTLIAAERPHRPATALAATLAIALTAGHPQTLLFMLYTGALAWWWWTRGAPRFIQLKRIALVGLLGAALSAAQLVPSAWFMLNSTRAGLTFETAGRGFALEDIALFAVTGVFNIWQPLFVGIVTLALAAAALLRRARGDATLWAIAGFGALVLSFGANALGFDLFYLAAPGYRQFQSQERHALIVNFSLAVLGAYGMHALSNDVGLRTRARLRRIGARVVVAAAICFAALIALRITTPDAPLRQTALLVLGMLAASLLLLWRSRTGAASLTWQFAVLGVLLFELFTANRTAATQKPADPFPKTALLTPVFEDRATRAAAPFERIYNHFGLPLNGACVNGLNEIGGGSPIVWRDYKTLLDRTPEDVLVKLLNVRYAVTWRGAMTTPAGVEIPWFLLARNTFEGKSASTYRLNWEPADTRGAWLAPARIVADEDALYAAMAAPGFDPFVQALLLAGEAPQGSGVAAVEGKSNGYMKIAVNADAPALLTVSEAFHPNWIALVDGVAVTPERAYGALLGVRVPAGSHSVELSYRPLDLYFGAALSALAIVAAVVLITRQSTNPRRYPAASPAAEQ